jgi:DNA repair exonuclease SbcCD ATPase subunit
MAQTDEALSGGSNRVIDAESRLATIAAESLHIRKTLATVQCAPLASSENDVERAEPALATELLAAEVAERSSINDERSFNDAVTLLSAAREAWSAQVGLPRSRLFARIEPAVKMIPPQLSLRAAWPEFDADWATVSAFTMEATTLLDSARSSIERALDATRHELEIAEAAASVTLLQAGADDEAALRTLRDQRMREATLADNDVKAAEGRRNRALALDRSLALIEPVAEVFSELGEALNPGRFPRFVVERKQLDLLRVGTAILGRMTADRFGFSSSLGIVDRSINQERKAHTLSGGETFLASLALSLALVEISERSGIRFESLFLDEGFGTLDPAAFEQALVELEHQVTQGRMIAVITHVSRVREFIDDVLRVTKTAEGSEVSLEQTAEVA